jgi:tetratricopeptide (TPR) repeat protein
MFLEITLIAALSSPQAIHAQAVDLLARGQFHDATLLTEGTLRQYNPTSLESALLLRDLAKSYRGSGYLKKAESTERREIDIIKTHLGEDDANMALALDILAEILMDQGRFTDAARTLKQALRIADTKLVPDNPHLATILNDLGVVNYHTGHTKAAAILFHRALAIREMPAARANLEAIEIHVNSRSLTAKDARFTSADATSAAAPGTEALPSTPPSPATHN